METVKVSVKGAGSLEVEGESPKDVLSMIKNDLGNIPNLKVSEVKLGRPKKNQA
jgi:hypothetical protein